MDSILSLGYWGLFFCGMLAGSIIPMNAEAPLAAAIAMGWPSWNCLFFAWLGNLIGATSNYFIGMLAKPEWIEKYARVNKKKMEKAQRFMQGKGIWLAGLNFLPSVGNAFIICLGMSRAPFWKIFFILAIGIFVRFVIWMWLTQGMISVVS